MLWRLRFEDDDMRKLLLFVLLSGLLSVALVLSVYSQEHARPKAPRLTTDDVTGATHSPSVRNGSDTNLMPGSGNGRDGISSISSQGFFKTGITTIKRMNVSSVTDLPPGYTVYNNMAFDVTTEAIVAGPHTFIFSVASVEDPSVFAHLRVLSREMNELDPATTVWLDRTAGAPEKPVADFNARTITGKPYDLGQIVVALYDPREIEKLPVADLSVQISCSPEPVVPDQNTTYTFTVRNSGPQAAPNVLFNGHIESDMRVISMVTSQGSCRQSEHSDGVVICHIGTLTAGATATVTVVVHPRLNPAYGKGQQKFPAFAVVVSKARESNYTNNQTQFLPK